MALRMSRAALIRQIFRTVFLLLSLGALMPFAFAQELLLYEAEHFDTSTNAASQHFWQQRSHSEEAEVVLAMHSRGQTPLTTHDALQYQWPLPPNKQYALWARVLVTKGDATLRWHTHKNTPPEETAVHPKPFWYWQRLGDVYSNTDGLVALSLPPPDGPVSIDKFSLLERPSAHPKSLVPMPPESNRAPTVSLRGDQFVGLKESAELIADVEDDGLMDGVLRFFWEQAGGAGKITFNDPYASLTMATFSHVGDYVVRFHASDGSHRPSKTLAITVVEAPVLKYRQRFDQRRVLLEAEASVPRNASPKDNSDTATWQIIKDRHQRPKALYCQAQLGCQDLVFSVDFPQAATYTLWLNAPSGQNRATFALQLGRNTADISTHVLELENRRLWHPKVDQAQRWQLHVRHAGTQRLALIHLGGGPLLLDRLMVSAGRNMRREDWLLGFEWQDWQPPSAKPIHQSQ